MRIDLPAAVGALVVPAVLSVGTAGWPVPGDTRTVGSEFAIVREEPFGAAKPVAQIREGQAVVEIQRQGNWLHVGVAGQGITGWIHLSFLNDTNDGFRRSQPLIPAMRRFRPVFDAFNDMKREDGEKPFVSVSERTRGELHVFASSSWWSSSPARRRDDIMSLYQMWSVANERLPVTIVITDVENRRLLRHPEGGRSEVRGQRSEVRNPMISRREAFGRLPTSYFRPPTSDF